MTLFYAPGTGWGHLYRTRQLVPLLATGAYRVLTNNADAHRFFPVENVVMLPDDPVTDRNFLTCLVSRFQATGLIIDSFPFGLTHTLPGQLFDICPVSYIARRLKWRSYVNDHPMVPDIHFRTTYEIEALEPEHALFVRQQSDHVQSLEVPYTASPTEMDTINTTSPLWLIVHTTHAEEVELLYRYACDCADIKQVEPYFLVLSDQTIKLDRPGTCMCHLPADVWFPKADVIFTGGGFNSMHMMRNYKNKHVALPFPRRYDDQVWRIDHMGANGLSPEPAQRKRVMEKLSES